MCSSTLRRLSVWYFVNRNNINNLQKIRNHCLRIIPGKPTYLKISIMHDILRMYKKFLKFAL